MPLSAEQKKAWYRQNRERIRAQQAAYYQANREAVRAQQNARRAADPEGNAARCRSYYAQNPEAGKARADAWRRANPVKAAAARAAYKARRRGMPFTDEAKAFLPTLMADPCAYCDGESTGIDHIVSLRAGGDGGIENLIGACQSCNASKRQRPLLLFLLGRCG